MSRHAYPLLLDVTDRLVVIIGGGVVASRKARGVLEAGATRVRMVAPSFADEVPEAVERVASRYEPAHLDGAGLVFAATDCAEVNDEVVRDARVRGLLVCRANSDDDLPGDFVTPAKLTRGPVTIAVDSYGPVTDNAQSVFELSVIETIPGIKEEIKKDYGFDVDFEKAKHYLEENDGAGNTFKATAKPVLIGTAVVGATTMIFSIIVTLTGGLQASLVSKLSLMHPPFLLGLIAGGALPGLAVLGFGGASAAIRVLAAKQKSPGARKFLAGISSIPALAGLLAKSGIDLYHKAAGTEEDARKALAQKDRLGLLSDEKNLERISAKRKGAIVAGENIERQGRLARLAAAFGAGWLFGHAVGGGHHDNADHAAAPDPSPEAASTHADAAPPHANEPQGLKIEQAPLAKPEVAPVEHHAAPEHAQPHASARHEPPAANPAQTAEAPNTASMSSEDKIAEIYKYQAEHGGLPPGSDANIDKTIEHIEHHDLEPQPQDAPASEASGPAGSEPVQPEQAPDPVQQPGVEAESASSSSVLPGEHEPGTIDHPHETAPAVENSSVPPESSGASTGDTAGAHEAAATPELNQNGFDLSRPDAAMVHGKYFGYGHTTKESYDQAVTLLMKNPKLHDGTPAYWMERQPGIFGDKIIVHALRFKPGEMVSPQPYAVDDALKPVVMPPVPKPEDYQPIPTR